MAFERCAQGCHLRVFQLMIGRFSKSHDLFHLHHSSTHTSNHPRLPHIPWFEIGADSYSYYSLKRIRIPNSIDLIGKRAFSFAHIDEIEFSHPTINPLEIQAFSCLTLKKIVIPRSVEFIGRACFSLPKPHRSSFEFVSAFAKRPFT
jgi:hypothetical protein